MNLYPYLFRQNRKTLVWGTEDWTVSAVPGSESVVDNGSCAGMKLTEVVAGDPEEILGKAVAERYHNQLPLLAKIIDAKRDLSIQVHPNDEMAQRVHGKMGKSEMWYIIKAEPGAHLYAGFKHQITPYEYQKRVEDGTITEVLADHPVKAGDVFYLPAGRVHAICGGILLAEVQQSSDITYRIFDYNRPGMDGKPRELHTELAAQALDYHVEQNYRTEYIEPDNRAIQIIDSPYFDVRVMEITESFHRNLLKYDSFNISMCLEGDCQIRIRPSVTSKLSIIHSPLSILTLKEGHTVLIPAAIADYDVIPLHGKTRLLDAFIDNMDKSLTGTVSRFLHITKQ